MLRERLAAAGLESAVVYSRLNRRKVDLAAGAATGSPTIRAEVRRLVDERLLAAGLQGLPAVVHAARELALEVGLGHPGVGSDGRHVEIGLTDKSDALRAVLR